MKGQNKNGKEKENMILCGRQCASPPAPLRWRGVTTRKMHQCAIEGSLPTDSDCDCDCDCVSIKILESQSQLESDLRRRK
jgi:hypothetical protein